MSTEADKKQHKSKKGKSSKKDSEQIEVLNNGPIHICDTCHAMLKVPDSVLEEEEIEEEDEDDNTTYLVLETFYVCPLCHERNVVFEDELGEEEDDEEEKKDKKKDHGKEHNKEHSKDSEKHKDKKK